MIALFPGRFDPSHLGHILTIMRIYDDYDKIIVGITDDNYGFTKPAITTIGERERILKLAFKHLPKVQVMYIGKGLRIRERFDDLPEFDIVVTANREVLKNMAIHKVRARFIERSQGIGFSGTELRQLIK